MPRASACGQCAARYGAAVGWAAAIVNRVERLTAWQLALIIALVAQLLFVVDLGQPAKLMFDETHYVPAAHKTFWMLERSNEEHPLFAKWLIGLSTALFGDTPAGWRALSTVAGTATVLSVFWIALRLFGNARAAATASVLTMLNQLVFIQARIAMLDVFMGAFLLLAIGCMVEGYRSPNARRWLIGGAVLLGLAVGSKWAAIPWAAALGLMFLVLKRRGGWPGVGALGGAALLGGVCVAVYFATFAPALLYAERPLGLAELIPYQLHLYGQQTQVLAPHTYQSNWWDWPLIGRPIWYLYEPVEGVWRGVFLVGNPAIMWGGLAAVAACLWSRKPALLLAAGLWLFAFGMWIVIPKQLGFYYYYYLPAVMLSLALAGAFDHYCRKGSARFIPAALLVAAAGLFVYFYPILSAAPLPNDQAFLNWIWFPSWP